MQSTITIQELREMTFEGKVQLIDVRSASEFASEHIPQAANIPMDQIEARLDDLDPRVPVVLICQSGHRAEMTRELLLPHHEQLACLIGGTTAWAEAGLPTVRSSTTRWSLERQVRLTAGLLVLSGTVLSLLLAPAWIYVAMFVGAGLTFAGLTNLCGMAALFAVMPWNRPRRQPEARSQAQVVR
ncbi:MAG TPA: rhodanese-like domain-containing protein [Fimbriimonadaceae bacterium]|nr:rhodanese-like domain-containing protein [Fimbriimonadaceae bacterium]